MPKAKEALPELVVPNPPPGEWSVFRPVGLYQAMQVAEDCEVSGQVALAGDYVVIPRGGGDVNVVTEADFAQLFQPTGPGNKR